MKRLVKRFVRSRAGAKARERRRSRRTAGLGPLGYGVALAAGAAAMYAFDPNAGHRRRARVRDEANHLVHAGMRGAQRGLDDAGNRLHGVVARMGSTGTFETVADEVLVDRVRTALGHCGSHPHAIRVTASEGTVELFGPIVGHEAPRVLAHVRRVRGVRRVVDALERHNATDGVPSLQGGTRRGRPRAVWPPGMRWAAGAAGALMSVGGAGRAGPLGSAAAMAGAALALRAATNRPLAALIGARSSAREIEFAKTIHVRAPIGEVFELFTQFENFPKFMRRVREVKRMGDGRYHWKVEGPAGITFEWDGIVTQMLPGEHLAWRSSEGAGVHNRGDVRFEPLADGSTRMTLRLAYMPPFGDVGHAFARLLGSDPKHELDEDLVRFKSLIERGKASGRYGVVTRERLRPSEA
jgi:uncharacterized membrane protein